MSLIQSGSYASTSQNGAQGQQQQQQQSNGQQHLQPYQAPPIYPSLPSTSLVPSGQALPTMTGVMQQQQQYQQQQRFGATQPSQPQQLLVENNDPVYGPLQRSTQALEMMLRSEVEESMASDLTRLVGPGAPSPTDPYTDPPSTNWKPFQSIKHVNLPDALFEEIHSKEARANMGLFPEIQRAWFTVDSKLFLWDYNDGQSFHRYEEPSDIIRTVGLVNARPDVFIESIAYLLVVCTDSKITLLGLSVEASQLPSTSNPTPAKQDLTLYQTDLSNAADSIAMTQVVGTPAGRIFMSGSNGCLYEVNYQAEGGFFNGNKCSLTNWTAGRLSNFLPAMLTTSTRPAITDIVIDSRRGYLYTIHNNSHISYYSLGNDGKALNQLGVYRDAVDDLSRAYSQTQDLGPVPPGNDWKVNPIVSIAVVEVEESRNIQLVAVTTTGARMYLSQDRSALNFTKSGLAFVRARRSPMPPVAVPAGQPAPSALTRVSSSSLYSSGVLLAIQPAKYLQGSDLRGEHVILLSPNVGKVQTQNPAQAPPYQLQEWFDVQTLAMEAWAVAEVPQYLPPYLRREQGAGTSLGELAIQSALPQRTFLILATDGMYVFVKQRPVDVLQAILEDPVGRDDDLGRFLRLYGAKQSSAMCYSIAAHLGSTDSKPHASPSKIGQGSGSSDVLHNIKKLLTEGGGAPRIESVSTYGSANPPTGPQITYSSRHDGLALYLARVLRPIWNVNVVRVAPTPLNPGRLVLNLPEMRLLSVQRDLEPLKAFLERHFNVFQSGGSGYGHEFDASREAWQAELASLRALQSLLTQAIEGIAYILLMIDYKISDVLAKAPIELQRSFAELSFQRLLTTKGGRDAAMRLVNSLIQQQIGQQLSIDSFSEILQQRCSSFCRPDDVLLHKALENMRRAKETREKSEQDGCLRESLRLFSKGTKSIEIPKLKEICKDYRDLHFASGAIELPLKCAAAVDPTNQAIGFVEDGRHPEDPRKTQYDARLECYACITETLELFDSLFDRHVAANALDEDLERLRFGAYDAVMASTDPLFHTFLYDWFVVKQRQDQLLELRTPFIEAYLQEASRQAVDKRDLLWKFYARKGRYFRAAQELAALAELPSSEIALNDRIYYLSQALVNAKSSSQSSERSNVEFVTDLEEKTEVAQVQVEVTRAVREVRNLSDEQKETLQSRLESSLLTVTELYTEFAAPLQLYQCVLLILKTSDHFDEAVLEQVWTAVLEEAAVRQDVLPQVAIGGTLTALARRFYPSEAACPLGVVLPIALKTALRYKATASPGWTSAALHEGTVPWSELWEYVLMIRNEQAVPFQSEGDFLDEELSTIVTAWLEEKRKEQPGASSGYFPAAELDQFCSQYLLSATGQSSPRVQHTKDRLTAARRQLSSNF